MCPCQSDALPCLKSETLRLRSGRAAGTHFLSGAGKQQIPFGNDRKKSKGKSNGGCGAVRVIPSHVSKARPFDCAQGGLRASIFWVVRANSRFPSGMTERKARARAKTGCGAVRVMPSHVSKARPFDCAQGGLRAPIFWVVRANSRFPSGMTERKARARTTADAGYFLPT
jgi:hypothetical protein